jgi:PAS domain S-box-containing protein
VKQAEDGIHVMAVMRDISERRRRESEVQAARKQLAATLDAIPDLLFEVDLAGRYLDFPSPREDLLAIPPEKLIGHTVSEILPQAAAATCLAALREANEQGRSHGKRIELSVPRGLHWFELSVARKPVGPGEAPRFIVISRDITKRRRMEEALRDSEIQLQRIIGATADGMFAVDRDGKVMRTNRRFAEPWRIPQELINRKDDAALLKHVVDQLVDPGVFLQKVRAPYSSDAEHTDTVAFKDGRTFER